MHVALAALGVLMVFSATRGPDSSPDTSFLIKQSLFVVIGFGVLAVVTLIDYRRIRDFAWVLYGGAILLLFGVLSPFGSQVNGAQAWFPLGPFQLQPAEFAKIALIVTLGALLAEWAGDIDIKRLGVLSVLCGLPMALILLQPDLGTVAVLVAIMLGMLLIGGLRFRYIVILSAVGIMAVLVAFNSSVLKEYQKDRLHRVPVAELRRAGHDVQRGPEPERHRQRRCHRRGAVRRSADPTRLRPRAADRLHLHRGGRGARLRRRRGGARAVRRDHLAHLAHRAAQP